MKKVILSSLLTGISVSTMIVGTVAYANGGDYVPSSTSNFYSSVSSFYSNSYKSLSQSISQDLSASSSLISAYSDSSNPFHYWINVFLNPGSSTGLLTTNNFLISQYNSANTPALFGDLYNWWISQNYKGKSSGPTPSDYQHLVNNMSINMPNSILANINATPVMSSSSIISSNIALMLLGNAAGQSIGYVPDPNSEQSRFQQSNVYYSFRIGQQAMRDAVIKTFTGEIALLNGELLESYSLFNAFCNVPTSTQSFSSFSSASTSIVNNETNSDTVWTSDGPQVLSYNRILQMIGLEVNVLIDYDTAKLQTFCASLYTGILDTKASILSDQIGLARLSALYGILSDKELSLLQ